MWAANPNRPLAANIDCPTAGTSRQNLVAGGGRRERAPARNGRPRWCGTGQSGASLRPVRHSGSGALDSVEALLRELGQVPGLREKKRGTFYRGSWAFPLP